MKSISEILGGMQILLEISFDLQAGFEEYLTKEQRTFLAMLRVIEENLSAPIQTASRFGRPAYHITPFIRAFLAKVFFRVLTMDDLRKRLLSDPNLRTICGFTKVPSLPTFSRRMSLLSESSLMAEGLGAMITEYYAGRLVGDISRDSTAIASREKPCNTKSEVAITSLAKYQRGRPRKSEQRPQKVLPVIAQQTTMSLEAALKTLDTRCSWGCKKNSQGNISYWKGYKDHLDVTDCGIPVSVVVTGANVHDSQVAIPLELMTETRVTHLYALMDAAYDSDTVRSFIEGRERVPVIDHNKRRHDSRPGFDPAKKRRYAIRTTVERTNSHLKDWFLSSPYFVKGIKKVTFQVMCGVQCLAALKILQFFIAPSLNKSA
jgi:transposase/IS5 family transposase